MLTTKTEILFDVYKKKSEGLFDFLATTFASSHSTSFIYNTKAHLIITLYIKEQSGYAHFEAICKDIPNNIACLLYTSPSPRDRTRSRMPSSA